MMQSQAQQNRQLVQKVYEQALNKRNFDLLNELIADDYTGIAGKKGPQAFAEPVQQLIKALPDAQWTIMEILAENDKVMVKWKIQGTHKGSFNGFAATGNSTSNEGMAIFTIQNGKIIDSQVLTDRLGFLQQLNVLPKDLAPNNDAVQFIDKFLVPAAATSAFYERMYINRQFIKNLPGFIKDAAYEYTNEEGNLVCITIAHWQNKEAVNKARETINAEYKKQGFDPPAFFAKHHIIVDQGTYTEIKK